MSQEEKITRQNKANPKVRFECLLDEGTYRLLYRLSAAARTSMAAVVNHLIRREKDTLPSK